MSGFTDGKAVRSACLFSCWRALYGWLIGMSLLEDTEDANERVDDDAEPVEEATKSSRFMSLTVGGGGNSCLGGALGGEPIRDTDGWRITTRGEVGEGF